jgi:serine/threonine protein kinase
LVVCRGPDWWVKIADFGISKRAREGDTALRTLTGTPAFAAPELLGFVQPESETNVESYTSAVDLWSMGVITFFMLTGEILFKDQRLLGQYATGRFAFPLSDLQGRMVCDEGCEFVRKMLACRPEHRPTAEESLRAPWLQELAESLDFETQAERFEPNW